MRSILRHLRRPRRSLPQAPPCGGVEVLEPRLLLSAAPQTGVLQSFTHPLYSVPGDATSEELAAVEAALHGHEEHEGHDEDEVEVFTNGDYAPTRGPCKRRWDHITDLGGTHWRLNDVGDVTLTHEGGVAKVQFEPQWLEWTPKPNQAV